LYDSIIAVHLFYPRVTASTQTLVASHMASCIEYLMPVCSVLLHSNLMQSIVSQYNSTAPDILYKHPNWCSNL